MRDRDRDGRDGRDDRDSRGGRDRDRDNRDRDQTPQEPKERVPAPVQLQDNAKGKVIEKFRTHDGDTGSAQVQVALLTERINQLTEHLKMHVKDHHSRYGLLKMVERRRKLLSYLREHELAEYQKLIKQLRLRK